MLLYQSFLKFYSQLPTSKKYYTDNYSVYDELPYDAYIKGKEGKNKK